MWIVNPSNMDGHMVTVGATMRMLREFEELDPEMTVSELVVLIERVFEGMDS